MFFRAYFWTRKTVFLSTVPLVLIRWSFKIVPTKHGINTVLQQKNGRDWNSRSWENGVTWLTPWHILPHFPLPHAHVIYVRKEDYSRYVTIFDDIFLYSATVTKKDKLGLLPHQIIPNTHSSSCRGKWGKMCHGVSRATPFSQLLLFQSRSFFYWRTVVIPCFVGTI